jgi:hypothetical protein
MQDIIEYNPDLHTSEEYRATYGRLMGLIAEYKSGIEARGADGQYLAPEDRRNELMGYAAGMETNSIAFNDAAQQVLAIREKSSAECRTKAAAGRRKDGKRRRGDVVVLVLPRHSQGHRGVHRH